LLPLFKIYRSSAGSGKTRALAKEYLALALRSPDYFKYILAVTFTNKSTQEMKDRIVQYLVDFKSGKVDSLAQELMDELGINHSALIEKSTNVLATILHSYSQFSISTIDAFFQKIIRSFTRESGLLGNFRLEIDNELVLREVVAQLMDELGDANPQLTQWVVQYAGGRLEDGKNWNINASLEQFAKEIFRESFKAVEEEILSGNDRIPAQEFLERLQKEKLFFENDKETKGKQGLAILTQHGITEDDFSYKSKGTPISYFENAARGEWKEIQESKRMIERLQDPASWPNAKSPNKELLVRLAETTLIPLLHSMNDEQDKMNYESLKVVEKNFYNYGLIADIVRKLKQYKAENNFMLLSDAPWFLNGVINKSDTPFIYEKVGSFYRNYLIDEFQDTSGLQWQNFLPLVRDALDQQYPSMMVGDVKQSVYRWRGGDLELLQSKAKESIGPFRVQELALDRNFRSASNLVDFTNQFFAIASQKVAHITETTLPQQAYQDSEQKPVKFIGKGFVQVSFLERENSEEEEDVTGTPVELIKLVDTLERLQQAGVKLGDIAILVRKNEEGQDIADYLLQFKNSGKAKEGLAYDVVSNESLRIDKASSILLLTSALKNINNPDDKVARGELVYEYQQRKRWPFTLNVGFTKAGQNALDGALPERYLQKRSSLIKLSLFELTETLIEIFEIGTAGEELAYIQAFQDLVLEFSQQEKNDLASFLEWWDENRKKKSIQVGGNINAASIHTVHKAKGLQFKFVIIPFCTWKLDHEIPPLLWCKTDHEPFHKLGHVAVKYGKGLEKTFFAADYKNEFAKAHLDNLNLLYVALTRAEEGMIVFAPKPAKADVPPKTVGDLLFHTINTSALSKQFNTETQTLEIGKLDALHAQDEQLAANQFKLARYATSDWRRKLVIKREGALFFQPDQSETRHRINHGLLMHKALSMLRTKEEVPLVLHQLNAEGVVSIELLNVLSEKLSSMLAHPVIGNWFSNEWQTKAEVSMITQDGKLPRPDRVISKTMMHKGMEKQKAIVIDFKTGVKAQRDRKQVEDYAYTLSLMGYFDVEAYLLYLENMEVVPVVSRMNLNLF
jgi:ATP-dependent helicase/nuclease subunit A